MPSKPIRFRSLFTFASTAFFVALLLGPFNVLHPTLSGNSREQEQADSGKRLFERETFGGNGRTCLTCHSRETGTVSPADAQQRFVRNPRDPLFLFDGSDDGAGHGVVRMLTDATILMRIPLAPNVTLVSDPSARSVVVRRGIPTTLNTPALDPVLMSDGRQPDLIAQAHGAIVDHAQPTRMPTLRELQRIAAFQKTPAFFSSERLAEFAETGRAPSLPRGKTASEKRGRLFFEDVPSAGGSSKAGICAFCHSGPMLNETNQFAIVPPFVRGGRFQTVGVSEINRAGNPVLDFLFTYPDGTVIPVSSPDPGVALITGDAFNTFNSLNAFKTPTLWGVANTAPYFHDNSAKTLEELMVHYAQFFAIVTDPVFDGDPAVILTEQDQKDMIAFMKLLR
jgi:cytochrome c peroxidase